MGSRHAKRKRQKSHRWPSDHRLTWPQEEVGTKRFCLQAKPVSRQMPIKEHQAWEWDLWNSPLVMRTTTRRRFVFMFVWNGARRLQRMRAFTKSQSPSTRSLSHTPSRTTSQELEAAWGPLRRSRAEVGRAITGHCLHPCTSTANNDAPHTCNTNLQNKPATQTCNNKPAKQTCKTNLQYKPENHTSKTNLQHKITKQTCNTKLQTQTRKKARIKDLIRNPLIYGNFIYKYIYITY